MEEFHHYTNNMGGLENFGPFIDEIDKRNKRILMEEEYDLLQKQKSDMIAQQKFRELSKQEIFAQQKYRKEQSQGAKFEKWLLIFNTIVAIAALLVSIFK